MRFTEEVLERAREITAERYPEEDARAIRPDCFEQALREFRQEHRPTLIVFE